MSTMTSPDPKIIDIIKEKCGKGEAITSLEYFPPRTEEGVKVRVETPISFSIDERAFPRNLGLTKHVIFGARTFTHGWIG